MVVADKEAGNAHPEDGSNAFDSKNTATQALSKAKGAGTMGGLAGAFTKLITMKEETERKRIARDRHHEMSNNFDA
jgi:signal transduction histidine kinase